MLEQSKIRVRCNSNIDGVTYVFVDGEKVGTIAGNQEELFEVLPGTHEVSVGCESADPLRLDVAAGDLIPLECKASFPRHSITYQWGLFLLLVPALWSVLVVLLAWLFNACDEDTASQARGDMVVKIATIIAPVLAIVCFRLKLKPRRKYYLRRG